MQATQTRTRISKVKATYLVLMLATLSVGSAYGYHLFTLYRAAQRDQPQLQAKRLIRDLRRYERQAQHFPINFHEINQRLWHTQPAPDYGREGKQARAKNYYYVYRRVADDQCVLWALPVGLHRKVASSYFFVIAPQWTKAWKGAALNDEQIALLPAIPREDEFSRWGLAAMPAQTPRKK
jgi:hypothetical protein